MCPGGVTQMAKRRKRRKTHTIDVEFSDEKVTSFGGLLLEHQLGSHLGLWRALEKRLPERPGQYSWMEVIQTAIAGLLSGARGTYATEEVRDDAALLDLLDLSRAPEEATFWRCLEGLGEMVREGILAEVQAVWTRKILSVLSRVDLLECRGFLPIFADGSLLEGSRRREGTTYLPGKGVGLMWETIFVGPLVAAQALAREGEGEERLMRRMLPEVVERVLKPLKLHEKALVLADSLYGDEPSLSVVEQEKLFYVVGAGGLTETDRVLRERCEIEWMDQGPDPKRGWSSTALCQCWLQCEDWPEKRLLVGRRVVREGELFPTYYGVMTNLTEKALSVETGEAFAREVWRLYDAKGRMELSYKELLSDLNLHHPPCREHVRNAGFYALATLAHTLGAGVKLIGSRSDENRRRERVKAKRGGVPERTRVRPRRGMRLWRVRRRLFTLPARISRHARRLRVTFLGVSPHVQAQFQRWRAAIAVC